MAEEGWRKCNSCKKPVPFGGKYWVCNVSTCNRKRTGLIFCNVSCWDAHVPFVNHRESWAEERKAPTRQEWEKIQAEPAQKITRKREPKSEAKGDPVPAQSAAPTVVLRRKG